MRLAQVVCLYICLGFACALAKPIKPFIDTLPFSVPNSYSLEDVFVDSRDMRWLNTGGHDLYRHDGANSITAVKKNWYLPQMDTRDRIWSAITEGSHTRFGFTDLKTGKRKTIQLQDEAGRMLELTASHYAVTYNGSEMWLLTLNGQLYRASLTNAEPKILTIHKAVQLAIAASQFNNNELVLDELGNLWFAQKNRLIRIEPKTGQQSDFSRYLKSGSQINWGISTAVSKHDNIFIGINVSNTLLHIDRAGKVNQVTTDSRIMEIQSDPFRGIIWIATTNGLYYSNGIDLNLQHYGPESWQDGRIALNDGAVLYDESMPFATIGQVHRDDQGNLLIHGNGALWKFITATQTWVPLFASEINLDSLSWLDSYFDRKAKVFYMPTHQAILVMDTQKPLNLGNPHVAFTTLKIGSGAAQSLYDDQSPLSIPYGEVVEINFVALPQMPSGLQRFRYRLDKDRPWIYREDNTRLLFSQLPPGQLNLEMQTTFSYNKFGDSQFLRFKIETPWWRSYLAYAVYILTIAMILAGLLSWLCARNRLRQTILTLSVFENISEGLCVLSADYRILCINSTMSTMLGWKIGEDARQYLAHLGSLQPAFRVSLNHSEKAPVLQRWQAEAYLNNAQGSQFIAELRLEMLSGLHSEGHLLVVAEDITERKLHERRLHHLSRYDHLTDIPNRLYFNEHLEKLLSQSHPFNRYALILVDLDDFKTINDSYGHGIGDQLLKEVARQLLEQLTTAPESEPQNIVARHSGDEFLILVKASPLFESLFEEWLLAILTKLAKPRTIANIRVRIKASMGVSFWPDNTVEGQMLLQQADMAMYQAKKRGKGGYAYFSETLNIELKRMVELENAILHQQGYFGLEVFYQPKICLATGLCVSAEALSRWRLASGELLQPGQWLPLVHPGEMETQLHLAILRQVCLDLAKFHIIQPNFSVSINVSPAQLEIPNYLSQILTIVDSTGINHHLITLEVLEDAGISNSIVLENLRLIREQGFRISIDDFGTGYSSLSHLNELMAHELKIDRYFFNGIPGDAAAEKLYINIIELAKRFELTIVAEGVETPEQLQFIKQHGCHYYQGYYYSPPVPFQKFVELLGRGGKFK